MVSKGLVLGLVGIGWLASTAPTFAEGRKYSNPKEHYSLQLPEGWEEIPKTSLESVNRFSGQINRKIRYVTGFQPQDRPKLPFPYILVQYHASNGHPSLDELLKQISEEDITREIGQAKEKMSGLVSGTTVGKPYLDREHHRVYLPLTMNISGFGKLKALCAICAGKQDVVQLNGYAPEADWPAFEPVFHTLLDSLKFEPGCEYDESVAQQSHWHFDGKGAFGGALIGGIAGAIIGGIVGVVTLGLLRLRKLFARAASKPE